MPNALTRARTFLARSRAVRIVSPILLFALLALLASRLDLRPDLAHLRIGLLSGAEQGNYHSIADRLAQAAARKGGRIENLSSDGSVANVERLTAAARSCEVRFGLVQAGIAPP